MRVALALVLVVCACADDSATLPCAWRILEGEVTNARDLGGLPVAGGAVGCGTLFRGGDLTGLSGCDELEDLAITTVVDLREQSTQTSHPPPACVRRVARMVSAPMPKLLPDTPTNYIALLDETAAIATLFRALGSQDAFPAYVHCVIGRDRASVATALVLRALGASRATILDEFALSADAGVAVKPACMEAFLDELENRGGIEPVLGSAGVTDADLDGLRRAVD